MNDIQPIPKKKEREYVRVEYNQPRDVQHLKRCLRLAREIDFAENFHDLLLRVAHLSRIAKEQEDAVYMNEVREYKKSTVRALDREKLVKKEKNSEDDGLMVCEMLGGIVEGNSCRYKKYEVGAGNRRLVWDRITPLESLREDIHVKNQYIPTRDAWENATD